MKSKRTLLLIFLLFPIIFLLYKNRSYLDRLIDCSNKLLLNRSENHIPDSLIFKHRIDSLKKRVMVLKTEEEFWKNRIRMARDTSVDMIIDLVDSVLVLEMKGVPMKESKIDEYRLSNLLFRIINSDSLPWFVNRIFVLKDDWATIPKEPIVIKEAPKSPREVDIDTPIEIPVDTGKVQIIFHFNENLSIQIDPEQKINDDRWIIKNKYDTWIPSPASKKEKRMLRESISPLQKYWIKLQVDNNDARVIYRALLQGAEIVVRLK